MLIAAAPEGVESRKKLRTAAYCRVSTDDIGQVISIEMQKKEYRKKIRENPNWVYYGTYVDDGFSGTNTAHRPGFRKMMEDAMAGKFDAIITKSVSRFARNLLDCIGWVRKLQEHDPPVAVIFEDVNLNTLDQASNLILFVLAMVAEEESHMKSEAMQLSLEWRFSSGRFLIPRLLGYESVKGPDGKKTLVIIPDEADTVRLMYFMLLNGASPEEIAQTLTELGRTTGSGRTVWTASGVTAAMRNERYCGDILGRKTWTPNFRDHKSKKNKGKKNRYYEPGHHEGIVTRAQWNAAQKILNSRKYGHKSGFLPLQVVMAGALTGYICINRSWAGTDAEEYYRVSNIAMGLQEGELSSDLGSVFLPDGGYRIPGLSDGGGVQRIARELTEAEKAVKAEMDGVSVDDEGKKLEVPEGFQVAKADMFSHVFDPVMRIYKNSILFNSPCVKKFTRWKTKSSEAVESDKSVNSAKPKNSAKPEKPEKLEESNDSDDSDESSFNPAEMPVSTGLAGSVRTATIPEYVEILFNPVERMLAVRECPEDSPNAVRWCEHNGKGRRLGAAAFIRILYALLGWGEEYSYCVPAIYRRRGDEQVLFFDLDNYIGRAVSRKKITRQEVQNGPEKKDDLKNKDNRGNADNRANTEDTERASKDEAAGAFGVLGATGDIKGIFYAAEDDEPQKIEDLADLEERLRQA